MEAEAPIYYSNTPRKLVLIDRFHPNLTLRVTVERDSYINQSSARAEMWTPAGWTEVHVLRGREMVGAESDYGTGGWVGSDARRKQDNIETKDMLVSIALDILEGSMNPADIGPPPKTRLDMALDLIEQEMEDSIDAVLQRRLLEEARGHLNTLAQMRAGTWTPVVRCAKCHGTSVEGHCWVDLNTDLTGDMSSDNHYCNSCEKECITEDCEE